MDDAAKDIMTNLLNGVRYYTAKETGAVFIPLPREMWAPALPDCGPCSCNYCKRGDGTAYWDTLVIPGQNDKSGTTFTVHMPALHAGGETPEFLKK